VNACSSVETCEDGACVRPCNNSKGCEDGHACVDGKCKDTCSANSDCFDGDPCTTDTCRDSRCEFEDVSCTGSAVCIRGQCVADCETDPCPSGQVCRDNGCFKACASGDADCEEGTSCDDDGACVPQSCEMAADCGANKSCTDGVCTGSE
jgi:hypothetical protein